MGFNRSGTQRYVCGHCGKTYTPIPKGRTYSEEIREQAIKVVLFRSERGPNGEDMQYEQRER